jgi:hypothetical protein
MMTLMVEQLRDVGRIVLNGTKEEWDEFASHFASIYREQIETKETKGKDDRALYGSEYVWKRNGPDHFCHSLLYALVGMQKFGSGDAKVIGEHPLTGVPVGTVNELPQADNQATVVGSFAPEQFRGDNRVF